MLTFFINLDSAIERRYKFSKTDYIRWTATDRDRVSQDIDKLMLSFYNFPRQAHLGRCACFLSHTKLLEHIVEHKLNNVLILEDDAIKINDLPTEYPSDGIVYVGGFIYNRKMMDSKQPILIHDEGINLVQPQHRMLGCLAYIIPRWQLAERILNRIYNQKRFKAIDIMLGNIDIKQYYEFPACFKEEGSASQISNKKQAMTEFYTHK